MPGPWNLPVAQSIPFNNTSNGFTATNVQEAIEEGANNLSNNSRFLASCGFDGNAAVGRFLEFNSNVDSNQTGFVLPRDAYLKEISLGVQTNATCTWRVQRQTPTPVTTITSISLSASRKNYVTGLNLLSLAGDEISVTLISGSCSRPIVYLWWIFI